MQILNLSEGFEPFGKGTIDFKKFKFPAGEPYLKLKNFNLNEVWRFPLMITTRIYDMDDLMLLLLATDAARRIKIENISVFIPYLPFARQDRIMVEGEPFSLSIIANILNAQFYQDVFFYDVHSDKALELTHKSSGLSNCKFVKWALKNANDNFMICSPDSGANEKIAYLCKHIGYWSDIIRATKHRDVSTGQLSSPTINFEDIQGRDVYIIDDICDGGGTFINLAKVLKEKNAGKIYLIVSHGIFSKGLKVFEGIIEHIYTTDSYCTEHFCRQWNPLYLNDDPLSIYKLDFSKGGLV